MSLLLFLTCVFCCFAGAVKQDDQDLCLEALHCCYNFYESILNSDVVKTIEKIVFLITSFLPNYLPYFCYQLDKNLCELLFRNTELHKNIDTVCSVLLLLL